MNVRLLARCRRRGTAILCVLLSSGPYLFGGCLDDAMFKRFRDAYAPGFAEGLSTAFAEPGQAEEGLRQMGTALAEALGALMQTRTPESEGGSSGSSR